MINETMSTIRDGDDEETGIAMRGAEGQAVIVVMARAALVLVLGLVRF